MRSNVTISYHPRNKTYTYKSYVASEPLEVKIKPDDDNYKLVDQVYKLQDDTPKEEEPSGYKYKRGDTLEWSGALYVCLKDTNGGPGESPYPVWDLAENHPELIN